MTRRERNMMDFAHAFVGRLAQFESITDSSAL